MTNAYGQGIQVGRPRLIAYTYTAATRTLTKDAGDGNGAVQVLMDALQDWGRKDPSRLAPEHIHEYLEHHGEPDRTAEKKLDDAIARVAPPEIAHSRQYLIELMHILDGGLDHCHQQPALHHHVALEQGP